MKYNLNGNLVSDRFLGIRFNNRGLNYGDGMFETMKFAHNRINFWEDHYFRLMANMRIVRMEIPMSFSPEFLEAEMRKVLEANNMQNGAARLKLLVVRKAGGLYTPATNDVDYLIMAEPLEEEKYTLNEKGLEVDLFKDYYKPGGMLSNLKSTSAQFYTIASIFRQENGLDECILINENKEVVEAISSNLFLVKGNTVQTPPLASGCLKGVMRKQVMEILPQLNYEVKEETFSPFALQKADEILLTNTIKGIRWVKKYRKKEYTSELGEQLIKRLNVQVALN